MRSGTTALRHTALVYDSREEYVARAVAFLREGLRSGEGAVVAHTRPGLALMHEALGPDAAAVTFVDVSAAYTRPAHTLAAYHDVYAEQLRAAPSLRAVADVQFGPDPGEWDLWTGYESVFNESFAHLPAWVLCTYDGRVLPEPIRDAVWRTHPVVLDDEWTRSDRYEQPGRLLRRTAAPAGPLPGLRPIGFGRDAEEFRERLARELVAAGVPEHRTLDMLLAATEVAANAVRHGGGVRDVRVGRVAGRFACEIVDAGPGFDDPVAGYLAPRPGIGSGLWIARRLTWQVGFFRAPEGFTAQILL
ncbi:sensor histidine kinase [Pseudonocardia kujensis]|uniref:sensor histidine kinase n=1 Tax=Pseudonocardia kujensis TaxID=1128675 RepID=UPI001E5E3DE2|nr:sensor histidine kinase [Pseudonocardia kujensis]MCE0766254.1 sensor histidine kinase [Pseudonocardia kujensis]